VIARRHQIFRHLAKALRRQRGIAMVGSLLAGTDETPGEVFLWRGRS
jgi:IMP dehydrogenase